jgi:FtsP/CotA-like multicopper oxidase with cupredoxin domain
MHSLRLLKWKTWRVMAALLAATMVLSLPAAPGLAAMPPMPGMAAGPAFGLVCTTSGAPTDAYATFTLTSRAGVINMPDSNTIYMWGYSEGGHPFQHPSPTLCVTQGQTVTVVPHNTLNVPVSIMFPNQENVLANGLPVQPQFDGLGTLTSLVQVAPPSGDMTYSFVATQPGTYLYESGTDSAVQVEMGLFGALVIRPTLGPDYVYNRADSQFNPDAEFLNLFSAIDPYLHQDVEQGYPVDINEFTERYWMINGRSLMDTLAPNFASYLPLQPYSALSLIHPYDAVTNPLPALTRYVSVVPLDVPMHPHGNNGRVIGRDGHPLEGPAGEDLSFEKFSMDIGPGQTWDVTYDWHDVEGWTPDNPVPVTMPAELNLVYGMLYSGSPYLGDMAPMPPGTMVMNQCGEFYIISHSHALYQVSAWGQGLTMMGLGTFLRVDPPLPNMCP